VRLSSIPKAHALEKGLCSDTIDTVYLLCHYRAAFPCGLLSVESSNTKIRGRHCGRRCGETIFTKIVGLYGLVLKVRSGACRLAPRKKTHKTFWPWTSPSIRTACKRFAPTKRCMRLDRTTIRPNATFRRKILCIRTVRRHFGRRWCRYSSADADNDQTTFVFFGTSSRPFATPKRCVRSEYNIFRSYATFQRKKGSGYRRFVANIGPSMLLLVSIWAPRRIH
jgi:hypothetical protein